MENRKTYKIIEVNNKFRIEEYIGNEFKRLSYFDYDTREEAEEYVKKFSTRYDIDDYSDKEIVDWFNSIKFDTLLDTINNLIGINLTYDIKYWGAKYNGCYYFDIKSKENLVDKFNFLHCAWEKFTVTTHNSGIDVNMVTGELYLYGDMKFVYEHLNGGINGSLILDFKFNKSNGWKIQTEKQRMEREKGELECID